MAKVNYKTTNEKMASFSAIAAGDYIAHIRESEVKETKNNGEMVVLHWEVLDGPLTGRLIFINLNIKNSHQGIAESHRGFFNEICKLAGFPEGVEDTSQLHRKAMLVKIGVKSGRDGYDDNNILKEVFSVNGNQAPAQNTAPTATQGEPEKQPWEK